MQRIKRLETGKAWAERSPWGPRGLISNVFLTAAEVDGEWGVRCNFVLYRSCLERRVDLFVGARTCRLRPGLPAGPRWKIARRQIVLDQDTLFANNHISVWQSQSSVTWNLGDD
jgi:3-phenylpropionate/cinnamic acid dioxygenase small subunit